MSKQLPIGTKVAIDSPNDMSHGDSGVISEYAESWDYMVTFPDGQYGYYNDDEIKEIPSTTKVKLKKLTDTAVTPQYATEGSACFDLCADEDIIVHPGCTVAVSTGLAFELPAGYQMKVLPRSGLSVRTPLRVIVGTVDNDYRGEVKVILWNTGKPSHMERQWCKSLNGKAETDDTVNCNAYQIRKGDRIAQAELVPIIQATFETVDGLSNTSRGTDGFGSTGTR